MPGNRPKMNLDPKNEPVWYSLNPDRPTGCFAKLDVSFIHTPPPPDHQTAPRRRIQDFILLRKILFAGGAVLLEVKGIILKSLDNTFL